MAKFNKSSLLNNPNTNSKDMEPNPAKFLADTLTITVTRPDGSVVLETEVQPRGFKPKQAKNGIYTATVGWYSDVRGDDCGSYEGFPVSGGLRLSLQGVKVQPGDIVDLSDDGSEE
jgi:hypothetical protein